MGFLTLANQIAGQVMLIFKCMRNTCFLLKYNSSVKIQITDPTERFGSNVLKLS